MAVSAEAKQAWREQLAVWQQRRAAWLHAVGPELFPLGTCCSELGCTNPPTRLHRWVNSETGQSIRMWLWCTAHEYPRYPNYARARIREADGSLTMFVQVSKA